MCNVVCVIQVTRGSLQYAIEKDSRRHMPEHPYDDCGSSRQYQIQSGVLLIPDAIDFTHVRMVTVWPKGMTVCQQPKKAPCDDRSAAIVAGQCDDLIIRGPACRAEWCLGTCIASVHLAFGAVMDE
jgi:hypothetical protein